MSRDPRKQPPTQITLAPCLHDASYLAPTPLPGEEVYCRQCRDYRTVKVDPEVWARCQGCRVAKRFGQDVAGARRMSNTHAMRYPTHVVVISRGDQVLERMGQSLGEGELPYDSAIRDRLELSRRVQAMLPGRNKPNDDAV